MKKFKYVPQTLNDCNFFYVNTFWFLANSFKQIPIKNQLRIYDFLRKVSPQVCNTLTAPVVNNFEQAKKYAIFYCIFKVIVIVVNLQLLCFSCNSTFFCRFLLCAIIFSKIKLRSAEEVRDKNDDEKLYWEKKFSYEINKFC